MGNLDSGIYVLKILLKNTQEIKVGALGRNKFAEGFYYYIGSAQKNLQSRVKRHLKDKKNFHWHIDYLLDKADVVDYYTVEGPKNYECKLFNYLNNKDELKIMLEDFGSSDCSCVSHLLFSKENINIKNILPEFKKSIQ
ncbi:MAG TPA: GIY-YIG nuclease family protein [Halanaerobiales bacterium]|nr:GIY-YIG nuclease family protein [Halanaerobiales bacterium]